MKRKPLLFLYGTPNLLGSLLGLLGLAAFFAGFIKSFWLFIVLGLYALGFTAAPRDSRESLGLKNALNNADLERGLEELLRRIRKRVSPPVLEPVTRIKDSITALLPHLSTMEATDPNLHVVKQTVTDYLPALLETYLSLPPAFARLHRLQGGKTPREIVIEQLDLLDQEMQQILTDVHHRDTEALIAHGRFLKNKFAKGDSWLV